MSERQHRKDRKAIQTPPKNRRIAFEHSQGSYPNNTQETASLRGGGCDKAKEWCRKWQASPNEIHEDLWHQKLALFVARCRRWWRLVGSATQFA